MPSGKGAGNHGSSGGSHFGSGSSGSVGSSGSHFGGGHPAGRRGGRFVWWYARPRVVIVSGRRYYSQPTEQGGTLAFLFSFLMMIAIFVLFFGLMFFVMAQSSVNEIKKQYEYYQNMIISAEADPNLIKTATITERNYNTTAKKWYFNYTIKMANGLDLKGYTFCVYTQQEILAPNYALGSQIEVAVNKENVDIFTDSVPMDYKNMPIERDGEYMHYLNNKNISMYVMIGAGVGIVAFIIAQVVVNKKARQLTPAEIETNSSNSTSEQNTSSNSTSEQNTSSNNTTKSKTSYENEITYCPYCGESITKGTKKCPKCKANLY